MPINLKILSSRPPYGTLPFNCSVSKIKTFKDCPAKYHYSYVQKLPRKERDFHFFGKFAHRILELFHQIIIKNDHPARCFELKLWNSWMEEAKQKSLQEFEKNLTADQIKEVFEICQKYLNKLELEHQENRASRVLSVEDEFFIDIDGKILLQGVIDRVEITHDGRLKCSDYKTSKKMEYLEKDDFQLMTYCFVACLRDPSLQKVSGGYIMLKHDCQPIDFEYTREQVMTIGEKFLRDAEEIQKEKLFLPKKSPLCEYCDAYDPDPNLNKCPEGFDFVKMLEAKKKKKEQEKAGAKNNAPLAVIGETNW